MNKLLRMTSLTLVMSSLLAFSLTTDLKPAEASPSSPPDSARLTESSCQLRTNMRKLWEDHVAWTRLFIIAVAHDLPNTKATTKRLLQNQQDIGNAFKSFYGAQAGDQLAQLLTEHILGAADVVKAAKKGSHRELANANRRWIENANSIASFLHQANPQFWGVSEMRSMLHEHLKLTTKEAVAELQGHYSESVAIYDEVQKQILEMSDGLTTGVERQFSGRRSP